METANQILSIVVSVITIIAAIFGFLLYFYNKTSHEIEKLSGQVDGVREGLIKLEKELISSSDSRLKKMLSQLSSRVQEIDEGYSEKISRIKKQIQSTLEELDDTRNALIRQAETKHVKLMDSSRIIDLDNVEAQGAIDIKALFDREAENRKAILALRAIIASHDAQLKKLPK